MESSDEDDDLSYHEGVTPQSKINSVYQSNTEKGIRKLCCELLDLKDSVENLCGNRRTIYLAFLRLSEEVTEMEHELLELRKHISAQGILVQDLMSGVCHELDEWIRADGFDAPQDIHIGILKNNSASEGDHLKMMFLDKLDILLAEHKVNEVIEALEAEERNCLEPRSSVDISMEMSCFRSAIVKRKEMVVTQLLGICRQPLLDMVELKKALQDLVKLGKGPLGHQILLDRYGSHLQKDTEAFLRACTLYPKTYPATLSKIMFSYISLAAKESAVIFGDNPIYTNKIVQWAEQEIECFVRLVKGKSLPSETVIALRSASICIQASLGHCNIVESQGVKLSKLLMVLLWPYMEEVLEMNFRRARRVVLEFIEYDDSQPLSPRFVSPLSAFSASSESTLISSVMRFIYVVKDIVEQLTPPVILHFGGSISSRILHLFDKYLDLLMKALPSASEDDGLTELKEPMPFKAETDSQQLALLGVCYTTADVLLPMAASAVWTSQNETCESSSGLSENIIPAGGIPMDLKEWKRRLQHSVDKLRDHFCQQYVLSFIYSREGKTRLDARIYVYGEGEDLLCGPEPLPSLPFQALFAKLQQLATVAGDVLLGKEKIQKHLLARLTETVVIWLLDEEEFWSELEDKSVPLKPFGLQQLILDMHFTVEIARFAGHSSRHVLQTASSIIARAIKTFASKGIDPHNVLPEDEWFAEAAKAAISKLLLGVSGSEASETEDEPHAAAHHITSDSDETISCSSIDSFHSFVSAEMGETDSPSFTDPES